MKKPLVVVVIIAAGIVVGNWLWTKAAAVLP
jgi:uncharacterized protein HemY